MLQDWKFHSTWEQRDQFRGECPASFKTEDECWEWCKKASHLWRGTKTFFRPKQKDGSFVILQGLQGYDS